MAKRVGRFTHNPSPAQAGCDGGRGPWSSDLGALSRPFPSEVTTAGPSPRDPLFPHLSASKSRSWDFSDLREQVAGAQTAEEWTRWAAQLFLPSMSPGSCHLCFFSSLISHVLRNPAGVWGDPVPGIQDLSSRETQNSN